MNIFTTKRQNEQTVHQPGFTLIELLLVASIFSLTALIATTVFSNIQVTQRGILSRQRVVADGRYILEVVGRTAKLGVPDYAYYADEANCQNSLGGTSLPCDLNQPQSILAVRDQTNVQTCYRWNTNPASLSLETNTDCTSSSGWSDITPADLQIIDFQVYIKPVGDPFRSPPASAADCPPTNGVFDQTSGTCACDADATNECWTGQTCVEVASINVVCATGPCLCKNPDIQPSYTIYLRTRSTNSPSGAPIISSLQTTIDSRVFRR